MKRLVIFCIVGLLVLFTFDWIITFGVLRSDKKQLGKVNKICAHTNEPDIAIFGSSVGEVGVNASLIAQKTKQSVYNYSLDGTPFIQYQGLLDEFNQNNKNTSTVILTETYFSLSDIKAIAEIERYIPNISNDNVYRSLHKIQPDLTWKCRYIPFYKYIAVSHTYYMNAFYGYKSILKNTKEVDSLFGYTPVFRGWEADQDELIKNTKPFKIIIDTTIFNNYEKSIWRLKANKRNVIIILTPTYSKISKQITDFTPLREALKTVARKTQVQFWDYTRSELCDDKSFFYNSTHLNSKGSDIFSTSLADKINLLARVVKLNH